MKKSVLALVTVALSGGALAQSAATPAISLETLKSATQELSSDAYEGRAPATAGEDKTVAYLIKRFQAAGLTPGNKGKWVQDVPLVELTARNVSAMTFTGAGQPVALDYRKDRVVGTYRVVPRVAVKDSPVVFVGYGIHAPERGWDDYAGVDVKGKTVVILVNDPDWQAKDLNGRFGGRAMTYYGRWTYKFEEAARQGAAAALIVHETEPAAYGWNVVQSSWTGPQLQQDAPRGSAAARAFRSQAIGWVQKTAAERIVAAGGRDLATLTAAAQTPGFRAVPLNVTMSVAFNNAIRRQASKNVIGILPGTTAPQQVVLYTAHWDHLGRCDAVDGDDICNGAVDNASGTAALIALAQAQVKAGPARRTIAFRAVTAEESGLLGSKFYAENPVFPLATTVGGVNMDSLNLRGPARNFTIVGAGKSQLEDMVRPIVTAQGRRIDPEANPQSGGYYRSDHFSFAKLGVPMLSAGSGNDMVDGGVEAGRAIGLKFNRERYHGPRDEYDPAWDWSGALQDLDVYYRLGRQLADGRDWPDWYKDAEFRPIRDKTAAARR